MRVSTRFTRALNAVLSSIEEWCSEGRGRHLQSKPLLRELSHWLAWGHPPGSLQKLGVPTKKLQEILDSLRGGAPLSLWITLSCHIEAYPRASTRGFRTRAAKYGLARNELRAVVHVFQLAGLTMDHFQHHLTTHSSVIDLLSRLTVLIEPRALEDILLATLEGHCVPAGRGRLYTEVYGLLFGTTRQRRASKDDPFPDEILSIARVATQLRARGTASDVMPEPRSEKAQREVAEGFFSQLELVGDYHSHPFATEAKLKTNRGWEMSGGDHEQLRRWISSARESGARPRVALVVAVGSVVRSRGSAVKQVAPNRVRIRALGRAVYISCYRLDADGVCDVQDIDLQIPNSTGLIET